MIDFKLIPCTLGCSLPLKEIVVQGHEAELELRLCQRVYLDWKGQALEDPDFLEPKSGAASNREFAQQQSNLMQRRKNQQSRRCAIHGARLHVERALATFSSYADKLANYTSCLRADIDGHKGESDPAVEDAMFNAVTFERLYLDAVRVIEEARRELATDPNKGNGPKGLRGEYADCAREFAIQVYTGFAWVFEDNNSACFAPSHPQLTWEEAAERAKRWQAKTGSTDVLIYNTRTQETSRLN